MILPAVMAAVNLIVNLYEPYNVKTTLSDISPIHPDKHIVVLIYRTSADTTTTHLLLLWQAQPRSYQTQTNSFKILTTLTLAHYDKLLPKTFISSPCTCIYIYVKNLFPRCYKRQLLFSFFYRPPVFSKSVLPAVVFKKQKYNANVWLRNSDDLAKVILSSKFLWQRKQGYVLLFLWKIEIQYFSDFFVAGYIVLLEINSSCASMNFKVQVGTYNYSLQSREIMPTSYFSLPLLLILCYLHGVTTNRSFWIIFCR